VYRTVQIQATQLRSGMVIKHDGDLYRVMAVTHLTPGKGRGIIQSKLRNIVKGTQQEHRFRSDERIAKVALEQEEVEFLYNQGDDYYFMNQTTYEQFPLAAETLEDCLKFLVPNMVITLETFDGNPLGINLPKVVELEVAETEPGLKGATASNSPKPATLETGLVVSVPPFVNTGDKVKVDTDTGNYLGKGDSGKS